MKKLIVAAALTTALMGTSAAFADELQDKAVIDTTVSVVSNKSTATESNTQSSSVQNSEAPSSSVFQKFDGMEKMVSLSEQDKALTGAAWLYYKDNPFIGFGDGKVKTKWIANCKTLTILLGLGLNKTYSGCRP